MPRFVWDGALAEGLGDPARASSCEAAVESPPSAPNAIATALEAGSRLPVRSPPRSPLRSMRSNRVSVPGDRFSPANVGAASPNTASGIGSATGIGSRFLPAHPGSPQIPRGRALNVCPPGLQTAPCTPAAQTRQLPYAVEAVSSATRSSGTGGTSSAPGLGTDVAIAPADSAAGTGSATALLPGNDLVANTVVGLVSEKVSELQSGAKSLLAELQQRDEEVRALRQALADLARETGTMKPAVRSLLGPREEAVLKQVPELDEVQQQQLQSVKRNQILREQKLRTMARRTGQCCDCETKLLELQAEMRESAAREEMLRTELADVKQSKLLLQDELDRNMELQKRQERLVDQKKMLEEMDYLRRCAVHSQKRRREAELDLDRSRMEAEDILSRKVQVAEIVRHRGGVFPLPSERLKSNCSYAGSERCGSECSARTDAGAGTPDQGGIRLTLSDRAVGRRSRLAGGVSPGACTPPTGSRRLRGSSCSTPPRTPVAALSQAQNVVEQMFNGSLSRGASRDCRASRGSRGHSRCHSGSPTSEFSAQTDSHWLASSAMRDTSEDMLSLPRKANSDKPTLRAINGCMPGFPAAELGEAKSSGGATRRRSCPLLSSSGSRSPTAKAAPEALEVPTISLGDPSMGQAAARGRQATASSNSDSAAAPAASPATAASSPQESPSQRNDYLANVAREVAKRMGSPDHWLGRSPGPARSPKAGHRDLVPGPSRSPKAEHRDVLAGPARSPKADQRDMLAILPRDKPPAAPGERSPERSPAGITPRQVPFERSSGSNQTTQPRGSPVSRSRNGHEICRIVSMPPLTCTS